MRRIYLSVLLLTLLTLVAHAACSRDDAMKAVSDGEEVTVRGCLTSAPDGGAFAVTAKPNELTSGALYSGSGEVPTYTYELVGGSDLVAHVGREVEVKGRLGDRDDEIDVEAESKTKGPETAAGDDTVKPAIETNEEMEIKVRRLHVQSVKPTGGHCPGTQ